MRRGPAARASRRPRTISRSAGAPGASAPGGPSPPPKPLWHPGRPGPYHGAGASASPRDPTMSRYLIGIDLGTTNSALAYVDLQRGPRAGRPDIQTFPVPQLVAPGEVKDRHLL